jgi:hypothetical protein
MIIFSFLILLSACNNTKQKNQQTPADTYLRFLLFVNEGPKYIPAKFWGSNPFDPNRLCNNMFSHDSSYLSSVKETSRCSTEGVVGVCISRGTGSVVEYVFYSGGYTPESAKEFCFVLNSGNNLPNGVTFTTEYNTNSIYYTRSF